MRSKLILPAAATLILPVLSCIGMFGRPDPAVNEALMNTEPAPNTADSVRMKKMATMFRLTEPEFWRNSLRSTTNLGIFKAYLDHFRSTRPGRWDTLMSRLQYCRSQQLGTAIDAERPDVRWELFLNHGPPTAELVTPGGCSRYTGEICSIWIFSWVPSPEDTNGREVACEADPGGGYPVRILAANENAGCVIGRIYPYVDFWVLPNWGQAEHDLWVGAWIPGNQFSQSTLEEGLFRLELLVYERNGNRRGRLVAQENLTVDLQIVRATLKVVKEERSLRAMGYLGCKLAPGDYRVVLSVFGSRHNNGMVEHDIAVPNNPPLSDLLLIRQIDARGVSPGIIRNNDSLYAVPEKELHRGVNILSRLEFILPPDYNHGYHVCASLHRIKGGSIRRTKDVTTGPILYIQDENGNPLYGFVGPSEMSEPSRISAQGITLLDRDYQTSDSIVVFELPLHLTMPPGQYYLRIEIDDVEQKRTIGSRATLIRIIP